MTNSKPSTFLGLNRSPRPSCRSPGPQWMILDGHSRFFFLLCVYWNTIESGSKPHYAPSICKSALTSRPVKYFISARLYTSPMLLLLFSILRYWLSWNFPRYFSVWKSESPDLTSSVRVVMLHFPWLARSLRPHLQSTLRSDICQSLT